MFAEAGWHTVCVRHEALEWRDDTLWADAHELDAFKVIWPVGFGPAEGYADRVQWLNLCPALITPMHAWTFLHGKAAWLGEGPETVMSVHAETLARAFLQRGGRWILKPNAGSFGRDVQEISDTQMIHDIVASRTPQSWLLQRYIDAIAKGETRTLVCADTVLGSYLRVPRNGFHANLTQGADAQPTVLSKAETSIVERVHQRLRSAGVGFAAIDTAGGYLVEVNVANPGGIRTLETLYECDLTETLVGAVTRRAATQSAPT